MPGLSLGPQPLAHDYDAVVVGSGYGGGVAACRLARAKWSVCVLERGRELQPSDFPRATRGAMRHVQAHWRHGVVGSPTGLFDFRLGTGISVLVGCGLGGTSLINAGVALPAAPTVFADRRWPTSLNGGLGPWYDELMGPGSMLRVSETPAMYEPAKFAALEGAAEALGSVATRSKVAVNFASSTGATGPGECTQCGNCVTGCSEGAKNTVNMTYLPDAKQHGAEIFTQLRVERVSPGGRRRWRVHAISTSDELRSDPHVVVEADVVVLGAGTLGSTEILMRSTLAGLPMSRELGRRFSGNGDFLGFGYDGNENVEAMGWGEKDRSSPVGPCICGTIEVPGGGGTPEAIVQDGVIPGPLVPYMPAAMLLTAALFGHDESSVGAWARRVRSVAQGPYGGAAARSLTFLLMSNDDDDGVLTMKHDRLSISWPGAGDRPSAYRADDILGTASRGLGATYLRPPWWQLLRKLVTVHPLGGCVMAERAQEGVVDDMGRVFAGEDGTEVYAGLYVLDGSIVPRPLGVNPSLTITALAERAIDAVIGDGLPLPDARRQRVRGADAALSGELIDGRAPEPLSAPAPASGRTGIRWSERLDGVIEWRDGECTTTPLTLELTIEIDDLDALGRDVTTAGRVTGKARLACLSDADLEVVDGVFQLFVTDENRVDTRRMLYTLDVRAPDGMIVRVEGHKVVHDDPGFDAWRDLTTLFVKVRRTNGETLGSGEVGISVAGVVGLTASIRALPPARLPLAALAPLEYLRVFLREVVITYGKALATPFEFAAPRQRAVQPSRLPAATPRYFVDGHRWTTHPGHRYCSLRLTRYQGGEKGPVILAPGFAMRASSFNLPTTEENLTEHLFKAEYDVWLFDYRAGIDLESANSRFTLDDVARQDWPTAVAEVRRATGASSVQVIGHCMGSTTALMATAHGLENVRSIVCSQNTLHLHMLAFSRMKARSRLSSILQGFGFERLEPPNRLQGMALDLLYRLNPLREGERCSSPVCRWAFAFFGPTHCHDRLNEATHQALRAEFGPASMDAMDHIALMVRRQEAVNADTGHKYFDAERLRVPILFLAGERNRIFLPSGARHTYALLRESNPDINYEFQLLKRYAHLDCIVGRNAHKDVFPLIRDYLDRHQP